MSGKTFILFLLLLLLDVHSHSPDLKGHGTVVIGEAIVQVEPGLVVDRVAGRGTVRLNGLLVTIGVPGERALVAVGEEAGGDVSLGVSLSS